MLKTVGQCDSKSFLNGLWQSDSAAPASAHCGNNDNGGIISWEDLQSQSIIHSPHILSR